jgi:hypothetical protein
MIYSGAVVASSDHPVDVAWLRDDFCGGRANLDNFGGTQPTAIAIDPGIGDTEWKGDSIGAVLPPSDPGGPTAVNIAGSWPNLGILRLGSGITINTGAQITQAGENPSTLFSYQPTFGALGVNQGWDSYFVFRLNSTTDVNIFIGFTNSFNVLLPPDAMGLTLTATTGGRWRFYGSTTGGGANYLDMGTADTNWHKFRMRKPTTSGPNPYVLYSLDGSAVDAFSAIVPQPSVALGPVMSIITATTTTKTLDIDYFGFSWSPTIRS